MVHIIGDMMAEGNHLIPIDASLGIRKNPTTFRIEPAVFFVKLAVLAIKII